MNRDERSVVLTKDGSPTLYDPRFKQHLHNIAGAMTESRHIFFHHTGLIRAMKEHRDITICEVGFGSGFHLLYLRYLIDLLPSSSLIHFFSVEKYPISESTFRKMMYPELLPEFKTHLSEEMEKMCHLIKELHQSPAGTMVKAAFSGKKKTPPESVNPENKHNFDAGNATDRPRLKVNIFHGDFFDWNLTQLTNRTDFFIHDPFSPPANPKLWSIDVFGKLIKAASPMAILGTYCAAVRARAAMAAAGWSVARMPGPPGKREATLASPNPDQLSGYKRVNEKRLMERFYRSSPKFCVKTKSVMLPV